MTNGLLTRRHGAVLTGFESRAIGRELHLSAETVRTHMSHVLAKLGAHTRAEAVAIAVRRGLIA